MFSSNKLLGSSIWLFQATLWKSTVCLIKLSLFVLYSPHASFWPLLPTFIPAWLSPYLYIEGTPWKNNFCGPCITPPIKKPDINTLAPSPDNCEPIPEEIISFLKFIPPAIGSFITSLKYPVVAADTASWETSWTPSAILAAKYLPIAAPPEPIKPFHPPAITCFFNPDHPVPTSSNTSLANFPAPSLVPLVFTIRLKPFVNESLKTLPKDLLNPPIAFPNTNQLLAYIIGALAIVV